MIEIYRKVFRIVTDNQKSRLGLLYIMMVLTGLFEAVGAATLLPFIYLVSSPETIDTNQYLKLFNNLIGFSSVDSFILFLGVGSFILIVIGFSFRAYSNYIISRFVYSRSYRISKNLLKTYLSQSYSWFLNRHSATLSKSLLIDSHYFSSYILLPAFLVISHLTVSAFFILLLIIVNPIVASTSFAIIGIIYFLIYMLFFKKRSSAAKNKNNAQKRAYKLAQETLGGIKEIKFFGLENKAVENFATPIKEQAIMQTQLNTIADLPTYLFQAIAFGGIIAFILIMKIMLGMDLTDMLPMLSLYAFTGFRLIPAFQRIYSLIARLEASKPVLDAIYDDLMYQPSTKTIVPVTNQVDLKNYISLKNVSYTYPQSSNTILNTIDLEIKAGTTVAFIGTTGSGKTTLIDLILGLLTPTQGEIFVDKTLITNDNIQEWQNSIGYVPQHIFLNDDTFSNNIAFGVEESDIDLELVKEVARATLLDEVILSSSPEGYETPIGEKGIRLSGGQRQRLGIARALYRQPSLLILDEATNALDYETENLIMSNIKAIDTIKTIIFITHRVSTINNCDVVYNIINGKVLKEETK